MKKRFVTDAEEFLAENMNQEASWPRMTRKLPAVAPGRRVFVWGDLAVELTVSFDAPLRPELLARWRTGDEPGCRCEIRKPSLGGFVGKAVPIAAELGCNVGIACAVSLPAPDLIRTFLECGRFDSQHVVACPGPTPLELRLQFTDCSVRLSHPGITAQIRPQIPARLRDHFDAVLIDPGSPDGRPERLKSLVQSCNRETSGVPLGIVGRRDWSAADLEILAGQRAWLFLADREVVQLVDRLKGREQVAGVREAMIELKRRLGPDVRLVVTRGAGGAWLMNGLPQPEPCAPCGTASTSRLSAHTAAQPVVLAAYTLLGSMAGLSDQAATRMGLNSIMHRRAGISRLPHAATIEETA
jgi:hypothetical protein